MAAEIAEDQPLIEPSTAWMRQLWAPIICTQDWADPPLHPAKLPFGVVGNGTLNMPTDFTALNNLYLIVYPAANANITMSVTISFGQNGQAWNTHTQTLNVIVAMLANRFTSVDLVTTFGALLALLAAGDHVLVAVNNQTATAIRAYGLDARYS